MGRVAYANTASPLISGSAKPFVQGVVGLDNLYSATSSAEPEPAGLAIGAATAGTAANARETPEVATGGPQPCVAAQDNGEGAYTADQYASAYGFSSLYGAGDFGAGQTVALVEFESDLPSDISSYQSCYGVSPPVTYVTVDGGAGSGAGQGEAAVDIEDISSLAPDVSIVVYQGPNTDVGSIDTYSAIVDQDTAKVISTSWGLCESDTGSDTISSENALFEEAAVQGQTVLSAAGDQGSEDCAPSSGSLAVDDPASQPFVTGVGGTEITALGPPPTEHVWNTGPNCCFGAGGGGISTSHVMPQYQVNAASSDGTVNAYSSGTPCGNSGGYCREVPDVSALAGPFPYEFYFKGSWGSWGGTSLSAPLWAALIALSNASSTCTATSVGFANPTLYALAASNHSAFHDVTSGDNDLTGKNDGLYPALSGYDMASGLGTPNGAVLPAGLCAGGSPNTVVLTNPGSQQADVGQSVGLHLAATDSTAGQTLTYEAVGLPGGLSIGSSTGVVSGVPTVPESSHVVVTAKATNGASDSATFVWLVAPTITKLKGAYGPTGGGTAVKVMGHGFTGTTAVTFGSKSAESFEVNKAGTRITAVSPAGSGAVYIEIHGPFGTSPATVTALFDYGPSVTRISPSSGPAAAQRKVVITGTNFVGSVAVKFGATMSTRVTVLSSRKIVAYAPPSSAGAVDVVVSDAGGSSAPLTYTYL